MTRESAPNDSQRMVFVTGPSGAGRTTAVRALEDIGFEVIDNLPLSLMQRLIDGPPIDKPLALGVDVRNRDFTTDGMIRAIDRFVRDPNVDLELLYLDASEEVLLRRYSETRRRHPMAPEEAPRQGIERERELLVPIRARADILIETGEMSPHDLRAEIERLFAPDEQKIMSVTVQSFSYKRGLPRGLDLAFDCRFLRNPHWDESLRRLDGRDGPVGEYVAADPRFDEFFEKLRDLVLFLLPGHRDEGKSHLSIGLGCTGGQHRSVFLTETLAKALAEAGWQVSKRHRELERRNTAPSVAQGGRA